MKVKLSEGSISQEIEAIEGIQETYSSRKSFEEIKIQDKRIAGTRAKLV